MGDCCQKSSFHGEIISMVGARKFDITESFRGSRMVEICVSPGYRSILCWPQDIIFDDDDVVIKGIGRFKFGIKAYNSNKAEFLEMMNDGKSIAQLADKWGLDKKEV